MNGLDTSDQMWGAKDPLDVKLAKKKISLNEKM